MCIVEKFISPQVLWQDHAELQCTAEENETRADKRLERVLEESCELHKEMCEERLAFQAVIVKFMNTLEWITGKVIEMEGSCEAKEVSNEAKEKKNKIWTVIPTQ